MPPAPPILYDWTFGQHFTDAPIGATGQWLYAGSPAAWDVSAMQPGEDYAALWRAVRAADGRMAVDEYAIGWDDWPAALATLRDAYRKWRRHRRAAFKPILYNVPPAPGANAHLERSWYYDWCLDQAAELARHPLAEMLYAFAPSLYYDYPGQPYEEWRDHKAGPYLADLRRVLRGTGVRVLPVISPVAAIQPDVNDPRPETPERFGRQVRWLVERRQAGIVWVPTGWAADVVDGLRRAANGALGLAYAEAEPRVVA